MKDCTEIHRNESMLENEKIRSSVPYCLRCSSLTQVNSCSFHNRSCHNRSCIHRNHRSRSSSHNCRNQSSNRIHHSCNSSNHRTNPTNSIRSDTYSRRSSSCSRCSCRRSLSIPTRNAFVSASSSGEAEKRSAKVRKRPRGSFAVVWSLDNPHCLMCHSPLSIDRSSVFRQGLC